MGEIEYYLADIQNGLLVGLSACKVDELMDEGGRALGVSLDPLKVQVSRSGGLQFTQKGFGPAEDARKNIAEIMRQSGSQLYRRLLRTGLGLMMKRHIRRHDIYRALEGLLVKTLTNGESQQ
jgi:hypothetical protein